MTPGLPVTITSQYRWRERYQAGDVELAMHMRILYNNDEALMIGVC
jgi:hypothetical protein